MRWWTRCGIPSPCSTIDSQDNDFEERAEETLRISRDLRRSTSDGALNHSLLYLGMGHDGADGTPVLDHHARVKGSIDYAPRGGTRTVEGGSWFQLFIPGHDPREKHMHYSRKWTGVDGHPYLLLGVKTIRGDRPWSLWAEMTTLFTTLYRGDTPSAPVLGRGILRINLRQVLAQLASFRVHHAHSRLEHLRALARFGRFCVGTLWDRSVTAQKRGSRGVRCR